MSKTYRRYDQDQMLLLPPCLRDWLPEGHMALFISDIVDELDISSIEGYCEEGTRGYPPYHPRMMLKVLIYAYCTGARSSRKIARKIEEDVAYLFLAGGNMPKFRTVAEFRSRHLHEFKVLFVRVLQLCQQAGLVKGEGLLTERSPVSMCCRLWHYPRGPIGGTSARASITFAGQIQGDL